jgi:hypothetical protein
VSFLFVISVELWNEIMSYSFLTETDIKVKVGKRFWPLTYSKAARIIR